MVDRVDQCPCSNECGAERQRRRNDEGGEAGAGTARYPNALVAGESLVGLLARLALEGSPAAWVIGIAATYRGGAHAQIVQERSDAQEERGRERCSCQGQEEQDGEPGLLVGVPPCQGQRC